MTVKMSRHLIVFCEITDIAMEESHTMIQALHDRTAGLYENTKVS